MAGMGRTQVGGGGSLYFLVCDYPQEDLASACTGAARAFTLFRVSMWKKAWHSIVVVRLGLCPLVGLRGYGSSHENCVLDRNFGSRLSVSEQDLLQVCVFKFPYRSSLVLEPTTCRNRGPGFFF